MAHQSVGERALYADVSSNRTLAKRVVSTARWHVRPLVMADVFTHASNVYLPGVHGATSQPKTNHKFVIVVTVYGRTSATTARIRCVTY